MIGSSHCGEVHYEAEKVSSIETTLYKFMSSNITPEKFQEIHEYEANNYKNGIKIFNLIKKVFNC